MESRNTRKQALIRADFLLVFILVVYGFAQAETGAIHGQVVDPQDAIVSAAKLKLFNAAGTKVAEVESDAQGAFAISGVDPGVYQLTAESPAFVRVKQSVSVASGQQQEITLKFQQIVSSEQQVTVVASAPSITTPD